TVAEDRAEFARAKAQEAEALERDADARAPEEPGTPETASRMLALRRQAAAALDEAEQALAEVPGTEAAQARTAERRRASVLERERAAKTAALLTDLDRARAVLATIRDEALDWDASARYYAAALAAYGLELSRPEAETAAKVRQAPPG